MVKISVLQSVYRFTIDTISIKIVLEIFHGTWQTYSKIHVSLARSAKLTKKDRNLSYQIPKILLNPGSLKVRSIRAARLNQSLCLSSLHHVWSNQRLISSSTTFHSQLRFSILRFFCLGQTRNDLLLLLKLRINTE